MVPAQFGLFLAVGFVSLGVSASSSHLFKRAVTCPTTPPAGSARINCGTTASTQATCLASGCCWSPMPAGQTGPACYVGPDSDCPALNGTQRRDCGNVNTTPASCIASGCCFVRLPAGQTGPNCFFKPNVLATICPATPLAANLRRDCGNATTTSQSCTLSGCCWQPLPPGTLGPNCYRFAPSVVSSSASIASSTTRPASSSVASSTASSTTRPASSSVASSTAASTTRPASSSVASSTAASTTRPASSSVASSTAASTTRPASSSVASSTAASTTRPASSSVTATQTTAAPTTTAATCPATPVVASQRIDCGDITTTAASCVQSGCCWNVLPAGQTGPYCYRPPVPQPNACPVPAYPAIARRGCPTADATTTPAQCVTMGCCWDTLPAGTPGPNCYVAGATAPGYGTPGSDPGTKLVATTPNPGSYAVIADSPVVPIAVAPVPRTNQIILLERIAGGKTGTAHSYTLDLTNNQFSPVPFDSDLFCVGGSMLPDGRVFNMGGWTGDVSLRGMRFFKTGDAKWLEDPTKARLLVPRWYPSALLRPDGKVIIFGGATDMQPPGVNQPNAEIVPHAAGDQVITVPLLVQTDGSNLYPITYIIPPDANMNTPRAWLFSSARSQLLNMETLATVAELPPAPPGQGQGARVYPLQGGHAMLPLVADAQNNYPPAEVIICGGGTGYTDQALAMDTCVRTTPSRGAAATWETEKMPSPRIFADMVALPDGTYLILNGAGKGWSGFASAGDPQKTALLYNPRAASGQRFTILASTDIARLYHAEAILALDGRVIVTGSTPNYDGNVDNTQVVHPNEHRVEAYSPPYLTNGKTRPTLASFTKEASGGWNYNTVYNITATIPSGNQAKISVTLITQGFITHSVHMGDKTIMPYIVGVTANGGNSFTISVRSPRDANIAQPQFYSLWVLDDGTPSVAQWVQIGGVPAVTGPAWPFGA